MVDPDYITALVNYANLNPANLQALKNEFTCLYQKIKTSEGKQLTSVTVPGQTVVWGSTMTLQDQWIALDRALSILGSGRSVIRRTTARYI